MEAVIYGCDNETHNEVTCELFNEIEKKFTEFPDISLALGFDLKCPPICNYCLSRLIKVLNERNPLNQLTLAFMSRIPTTMVKQLYSILTQSKFASESLSIRWADSGYIDESLAKLFSEVKQQKINFKLDTVRLDDIKGQELINALKDNEFKLEDFSISLKGNLVGNLTMKALSEIIVKHQKSLKVIEVVLDSNNVTDDNSLCIGQSFRCVSQTLQRFFLSVNSCLLDADGIKNITQNLPQSIQSLRFAYAENMLGDEKFIGFCQTLSKQNADVLEQLDLDFADNEFSDEGVVFLARAISQMKNLCSITLNLKRNSFGDQGLSALFSSLKKLVKLKIAHLDISGINPNSMAGFEDFIINSNLHTLNINMQDNEISAEGVSELCIGIQTNTTITDLSLNFFYGRVQNLEKLFVTLSRMILASVRTPVFHDLNIATNDPKLQQLQFIHEKISLVMFSKIMQLSELKKILQESGSSFNSVDLLL